MVRRRRHRVRAVKAHRSFDPRAVGRLECDAWVAYYRREWPAFLRAAILLTRHTFGLSWPLTVRGAWLVLRANQLWAPYPVNDPDGARRAMERFYRLVKRRHDETFDPARAAMLEVEWWRVHREHQHASDGAGDDVGQDAGAGVGQGEGAGAGQDADESALIDALAALYAYVYGVPEQALRVAAGQRALAMRHSDQWVREGCVVASPLVAQERAALVRSYAGLLAAVHQP